MKKIMQLLAVMALCSSFTAFGMNKTQQLELRAEFLNLNEELPTRSLTQNIIPLKKTTSSLKDAKKYWEEDVLPFNAKVAQ